MSASGFWLVAIVVSSLLIAGIAGFVAFANIKYQRAREAEIQQALAREARAVLATEVRENIALVDAIESRLGPTQVPLLTFQTSAWQTVSAGELVRGFRGKDLARVAGAYELVNRANETLGRLVELNVGVASAMSGAAGTREIFAKNLTSLLGRLRTALTEVQAITEPNRT